MTDYISREAALEVLKTDNYIMAGGDKAYLVYMPYRDMVRHLQNLPAADVAPVVHGRWVHPDPNKRPTISGICSICRWEAHFFEDDIVGEPYCPHCGATMDGG